MSNNAHELSNRLLNALDNNYNVVDMHAVNEIISILEKINITKELLETTRLGKHVNELRRKTADPSLARRAKVLVKRWRDLVIPARPDPAHTGSNRSSAERQVRRLGGTPLTSPALSRVVSPAVNSPRPPSRPAWGGYESDSNDVILVDDDPPPAPAPAPAPPRPAPAPAPEPVKRPLSPEPVCDEKKAKRDKKPKKRRGHSRAGGAGGAGAEWGGRNGHARRNGCRDLDPYSALVRNMPQPGAKKVKTTKELLEQIQSRGAPPPRDPAPADDDVLVVDDPIPVVKVESPVRNGGPPSPPIWCPPVDLGPIAECTCGTEEAPETASPGPPCPLATAARVTPVFVHTLHHALVPGVNGTRAPPLPHAFARRGPSRADRPDLFASVVPLYNYSDYADDYCVKNMARVPICAHLPWTEFAPPPSSPPPPPSPPPVRPYPVEEPEDVKPKEESMDCDVKTEPIKFEYDHRPIAPEMVSVPTLEPSERLKAPLLMSEDERQFGAPPRAAAPAALFATDRPAHRTVERTKTELDGRTLCSLCDSALRSVPFNYNQVSSAPVLGLPTDEEAESALHSALEAPPEEVDELGRPPRPADFAEWHESARLGDLIALPYVVID